MVTVKLIVWFPREAEVLFCSSFPFSILPSPLLYMLRMLGAKWPGHKANYWPFSSNETETVWSCTFISPYVFKSHRRHGSLLWVLCIVRQRSLRRADYLSRGVLPTVVRSCVWSRNLANEEAMAHWGAVALKTNKQTYTRFQSIVINP